MNELDSPFTIEYLMEAAESSTFRKDPGDDAIPSEFLIAGGTALLAYHHHGLLLQCWE